MTTPNNTNGNRPTIKQKVSGVILIDKPQGMTSQQVVSKVKWLFKSPEHDSKKRDIQARLTRGNRAIACMPGGSYQV